MKMKCPACVKAGKTSRITVGDGETTLMSIQEFYDDAGNVHFHNPNKGTARMYCSNGHELRVVRYSTCLTCNWRGGEDRIEVVNEVV